MLVSKAFTAKGKGGLLTKPAPNSGTVQLPQTAEALATVDNSVRSVATRAE